MREIKIRQAWKNNETGVISYSYWTLDQLKNGINGVDNHTLLADDLYTGLKDKNGREIYEGDIVRWDEHYSGDYRNRVGQAPVIFEEGGFELDTVNAESLAYVALNSICEVIGTRTRSY